MTVAGTDDRSSKTILIAEDNDLVRHIYVATLKNRGFQVIEAEPDEVLELAREHLPDLVILDIVMPGISGMDLIRDIRADPQLAGLRVVAATTIHDEDSGQRLLEAGFDVYVPKPIALDAFGELIVSLLA